MKNRITTNIQLTTSCNMIFLPSQRAISLLFLTAVLLFADATADANFQEELFSQTVQKLSDVQEELLPIPGDFVGQGVYFAASFFFPINAESQQCRDDSELVIDSVMDKELWALRMLDASTKINAGVLDGNVMDLGMYDQCLDVVAPEGQFTGQMCLVESRGLMPDLVEKANPEHLAIPSLRSDVVFSLCVPSSCSYRDVKVHLDNAFGPANATAILYDTSCSTATPRPYRPVDYAAMLVITLLATVITFSTWYEMNTSEKGRIALLCSFSLPSNTRQLLRLARPPQSLPCLDGLRVLAMGWIILGHRAGHMVNIPNMNIKTIMENAGDKLSWQPIQQFMLSVDIFWLLSGTLVAYNFLADRRDGKPFNYILFMLRRYFRLTPALAAVALLMASLVSHMCDGPMWGRLIGEGERRCQQNWWTTLSYSSNYVRYLEICLPQTWFLDVDFQLHALSPLILFPLHRRSCWGFFLVVAAFVATNVASICYMYNEDVPTRGFFSLDRSGEEKWVVNYSQTQYRAASFLLGLALGHFVLGVKQNLTSITLTRARLVVYWLLASLLICTPMVYWTIIDNFDLDDNLLVKITLYVLRRPAIAIGVAIVVVICTLGHGGIVNSVLGSRRFLPFSRLTYCTYLTHCFCMDLHMYSSRVTGYTSLLGIWYVFVADFFICYMTAAILYLSVEAPATNISNMIFKGSKTGSGSLKA